jgi:hypothetical protein
VADRLRRVDDGHGADGAGTAAEFLHRIDPAQRVRYMREREHPHGGREHRVERRQVESALGVDADHGHIAQRGAGGLGDLLPGDEIRVMLHLGREDHVAGLEPAAETARDDVDAFGRAAGEDDLRGIGGVDEFRDAGPGPLKRVGRPIGQRVQAAMDVAVVALVIPDQRVDHAAGLLRRCSIIEIDERLAVDLLVQDREVGADVFPGGRHET